MAKWRLVLVSPNGTRHTFTTKDITGPIEPVIEKTKGRSGLEGAELRLVQQIPTSTRPNRIRFCPFCGVPFDEDDAPEGRRETFCYECDNEVEVANVCWTDDDLVEEPEEEAPTE